MENFKRVDIDFSSYQRRLEKICTKNTSIIIIIIIITLFKVDKNTNVIKVTSNKIAAISIEKR